MKKEANFVIHDKKLPETIANNRCNFQVSNEGKTRRRIAFDHQKNFQGS